MKNTFALLFAGAVLAAGTLFAAPINDLTVTLPHVVTVGSTTLPAGTYTMTPMESSDGTGFFVVRGANVSPVVLPVQKVEGESAARTAVTLTESGDTWRMDKLSIQGETTAYEFGVK